MMKRSSFSGFSTPPKRGRCETRGYVHMVSETKKTIHGKSFVSFQTQTDRSMIRSLCFNESMIDTLREYQDSQKGFTTDASVKPDSKMPDRDVLILDEKSSFQEASLNFEYQLDDIPLTPGSPATPASPCSPSAVKWTEGYVHSVASRQSTDVNGEAYFVFQIQTAECPNVKGFCYNLNLEEELNDYAKSKKAIKLSARAVPNRDGSGHVLFLRNYTKLEETTVNFEWSRPEVEERTLEPLDQLLRTGLQLGNVHATKGVLVDITEETTVIGPLTVLKLSSENPEKVLKVKAWKDPGPLEKGNIVVCEGKVKEYQGELFVSATKVTIEAPDQKWAEKVLKPINRKISVIGFVEKAGEATCTKCQAVLSAAMFSTTPRGQKFVSCICGFKSRNWSAKEKGYVLHTLGGDLTINESLIPKEESAEEYFLFNEEFEVELSGSQIIRISAIN